MPINTLDAIPAGHTTQWIRVRAASRLLIALPDGTVPSVTSGQPATVGSCGRSTRRSAHQVMRRQDHQVQQCAGAAVGAPAPTPGHAT